MKKPRPLLLFITGCILASIAIASIFFVPMLILQQIYERLELKEGTETYKYWKEVPFPIYNRFYFYNVTNAREIERRGEKPILKEIGPFTYRVFVKKTSIKFHDNATLSYREVKTWRFMPKLSVANENQIITTINAPLAITLTLIQSASPAVRVLVTLALDAASEGFFIKRTVKQLLFAGYPDLLTTFAPLLRPEIPTNNEGRFGFFYPVNNTDDGLYTVHTGAKTIDDLNFIDQFNGSPELHYWNSDTCNSIHHATNGQMGPPLEGNKPIKVFFKQLCRTTNMIYERKINIDDGLIAKRFNIDPNVFKNAIDYPPNKCFSTGIADSGASILSLNRNSQRKAPFPSGIIDISVCKYGTPIVLSLPHFLDADPYYLKTVDGLSPNKSKHEFYMDKEPVTGVTVGLKARMQLNVYISKGPGLFRYRHIPEIVFPVLWQETDLETTSDLVHSLKLASRLPDLVAKIAFSSLLSIAVILIFSATLITIIPIYKSRTARVNGNISPTIEAQKTVVQDDVIAILPENRNSVVSDLGIDNPVMVQ